MKTIKNILKEISSSLKEDAFDLERASEAYLKIHQSGVEADRLKAIKKFQRKHLEPIPWLKDAQLCLADLDQPPKGHYQGHVYVVLVGGLTESNGYYGAYVGSSRYTAATRFAQHKASKNSSGIVKNRGIQLLDSLMPWPIVPGGKAERIYWESALHVCLATAIPRVYGDFKPTSEWPAGFQPRLQERLKVSHP